MHHAGLDALTRAHVDHIEFTIALACCQNQIVRLLVIAVQANLTDCSSVAFHLQECVLSVDIPEGQPADTIPRHRQRIAPSELHYRVSVPFEEALYALKTIQLPNEQVGVIGAADCDILRVDGDLRNRAIMPDQVRAFDSGTIPQAKLFVHGAGHDAAVTSHRTSRHPVCMPVALAKELSDLPTRA